MSLKVVRKINFWRNPSSKIETGGFIKDAAGVFINLLQSVQQMGKNKEHCKTLITSITQLLKTVNEELRRFLGDTKDRLNQLNTETRFLSRYLRAERIRDIISGYQTEMQRLKIDLLLANVLAMRVQGINSPKTQGNVLSSEDDLDMDDVRAICIKNDDTKANDKTETVEEYLATVDFGGRQRSAMVRMYKGHDAQQNWREELQIISGIRHPNVSQLVAVCRSRKLPALIFDGELLPLPPFDIYKEELSNLLVLHNSVNNASTPGNSLNLTHSSRVKILFSTYYQYNQYNLECIQEAALQIREYRSVDNCVAFAIEKMNSNYIISTDQYDFDLPVYSEDSFSEDILGRINSPRHFRQSTRHEMISLLDAFHLLVPLESEPTFDWRNVPLGGIFLSLPRATSPNYQVEAHQPRDDVSGISGHLMAHVTGYTVFYSQWHYLDKTIDKYYET
ncbi:hypothetical protein M422DRAFT_248213 [Sphaerobolus stellatus SS14]|uniref:Protein kinase domain-containing protein n=1 Tax=Sphaerobolus stellatus (strain SS14) TaxID=990650 RepID=A0A0C9VJ90_SPHS4|nr:hypothetical protein M422DRAFT_248213 [Sphaerobolus stellatus SS14]